MIDDDWCNIDPKKLDTHEVTVGFVVRSDCIRHCDCFSMLWRSCEWQWNGKCTDTKILYVSESVLGDGMERNMFYAFVEIQFLVG